MRWPQRATNLEITGAVRPPARGSASGGGPPGWDWIPEELVYLDLLHSHFAVNALRHVDLVLGQSLLIVLLVNLNLLTRKLNVKILTQSRQQLLISSIENPLLRLKLQLSNLKLRPPY
ncbi:unnamed protein product [Sphagnum balticum]